MKNLVKKVSIIITVCIMLTIGVANAFAAETNEVVTAKPNNSPVLINGNKVDFESYNINDNNYFKLRDLAMALNGTEKGFEVAWDQEKNAIVMTSNMPYTTVGGELTLSENIVEKESAINTSTIYLGESEVTLTAYNIDGFNYFKLRDIGTTFDFKVDWNQELQTISVDTTQPYTVEEVLEEVAQEEPVVENETTPEEPVVEEETTTEETTENESAITHEDYAKIIGKWQQVNDSEVIYEFFEDGTFKYSGKYEGSGHIVEEMETLYVSYDADSPEMWIVIRLELLDGGNVKVIESDETYDKVLVINHAGTGARTSLCPVK